MATPIKLCLKCALSVTYLSTYSMELSTARTRPGPQNLIKLINGYNYANGVSSDGCSMGAGHTRYSRIIRVLKFTSS